MSNESGDVTDRPAHARRHFTAVDRLGLDADTATGE